MEEDVRHSDYALLRKRGSKTLVIAFAGINTRPGHYTYYKAFREFDTLLVNCPGNEWFYRGVPFDDSEDYSLESTIDRMRAIADGYRRVVLLGGSMGAYGAVLFSAYIPNVRTVAMSPEIYPGLRTGFFAKTGKQDIVPPCLSALFAHDKVSPIVFAAEKKSSDLYCLLDAKPKQLFTLKNCYHTIPTLLHATFGTIEGLVKAVLDGSYTERLADRRGQIFSDPMAVAAYYLSDIQSASPQAVARQVEISKGGYYASYLCTSLANRFQRSNNHKAAADWAKRGIELNPADLDNHVLFAQSWQAVHGRYPDLDWERYKDDGLLAFEQYKANLASLEKISAPASVETTSA